MRWWLNDWSQSVPECCSCLLLLTVIGLLTAHNILLNKQAVANAALPSLHRLHRERRWRWRLIQWMTGERDDEQRWQRSKDKMRMLLRRMSMEPSLCPRPSQDRDAALCWSLWSSGWGLAYVSQEHGDICAIIYSQQIRWEAWGLLREGIIWEPKDQPGCHQAQHLRRGTVIRTALHQLCTETSIY